MLRHLIRGSLVLGLFFSAAACYNYVPLQGPAEVGSEVRARLTNETALQQSELLGVLTPSYQGRVMAVTSDSLMLSVVAARAVGPAQTQTARRIVGLPITGVAGLEERKLSRMRTAIAVLGTGAAVAGIVGGILTVGGNEGDGGPDPDPAFRPGFRFTWPFGR